MLMVEHQGEKFQTDQEGFLFNLNDWNLIWADYIRKKEDLDELIEDHFLVLEVLQDYFKEQNQAPKVKMIPQLTGFKLKYIYELFPSGPGKGACKMAGLPKPEGCV